MAQLKAHIGKRANEVIASVKRLEDQEVIRDTGVGNRHAYHMVNADDSQSSFPSFPYRGEPGTMTRERSHRSEESSAGMPLGTTGNDAGMVPPDRSGGSIVPDPGTMDEEDAERAAIQGEAVA